MKKRLSAQSKASWTKKKTAILIVAIFVGLGIVAGLTGYFLSRKEETKAAKGTVFANGGAVADNQGDFATIKVVGGKNYLQFTLGNRLGIHNDDWANSLKNNLGKNEGYVDMPLEVWNGKNWVDAFYYLLGKEGGKGNAPSKFLEGTGLQIFWAKPGFVFKQTEKKQTGTGVGGTPIYSTYKKTYYSASKLNNDPTLQKRWCVRFGFNTDNYAKVQEKTFTLDLDKFPVRSLDSGTTGDDKGIAKSTRKIGDTLLEYRTYFYHHSRAFAATYNLQGVEIIDATDKEKEGIRAGSFTGTLDEVKAAGQSGLSAPQTLNGAFNQSNHAVLTWDQKSGLNAKGYIIRKRIGNSGGWTSESAMLNYPASRYEDPDTLQSGTNYNYQILAVSYFDGTVRAEGGIKSLTLGGGGSVAEPVPPQGETKTHPAPINLVAKSGDSKVALHWKAPTNLTVKLSGYLIGRADGKFGTVKEMLKAVKSLGKVTFDQVSYLDTTVTNGNLYHYVVFAIYKDGKTSDPCGPAKAKPQVGGGSDIPEDVNLDGLVNWLDVARVLAYNGFPGVKVDHTNGTIREDVNRDNVCDWLDIGRILAYTGFPQTGSATIAD